MSPKDPRAREVLQFPRNMFRGTARAFVADSLAREAARSILSHGWDRSMDDSRRLFAYLPFEHSVAFLKEPGSGF